MFVNKLFIFLRGRTWSNIPSTRLFFRKKFWSFFQNWLDCAFLSIGGYHCFGSSGGMPWANPQANQRSLLPEVRRTGHRRWSWCHFRLGRRTSCRTRSRRYNKWVAKEKITKQWLSFSSTCRCLKCLLASIQELNPLSSWNESNSEKPTCIQLKGQPSRRFCCMLAKTAQIFEKGTPSLMWNCF